MISPPTLPHPKPSIDTRSPVRPNSRYSMAVLLSSFICDTIDDVGTVIGNEQSPIRHHQHIDRSSPGPAIVQPALGKGFIRYRPMVVKAHQRQAIANGRGAVPRAMFGDENLLAIRFREHRARIKAHAERRHMGAEVLHRRGELRARALAAKLRVGDAAAVAIGKPEVHPWLPGMIQLIRRAVVA